VCLWNRLNELQDKDLLVLMCSLTNVNTLFLWSRLNELQDKDLLGGVRTGVCQNVFSFNVFSNPQISYGCVLLMTIWVVCGQVCVRMCSLTNVFFNPQISYGCVLLMTIWVVCGQVCVRMCSLANVCS
jgi:hypothetical protein